MLMKKTAFLLTWVAALTLGSCSQQPAYLNVKPMAPEYDIHHIENATMPVCFEVKDFSWKDGKLKMKVYSEDRYSANEINLLKAGDTLTYSGKPIIVKQIDKKEKSVTINQGLEQGGADLITNKDGSFRAMEMDGYATFTELGDITLPLSKNLVIQDCGSEPTNPAKTIRSGYKKYLESQPDYHQTFNITDTQVDVKNGVVVGITRRWTP